MSSPAKPGNGHPSPEGKIDALRKQTKQLKDNQATTAGHQAKEDTYERSQVRFRAVFDRSPLGHKIIDADLTIRQANPVAVAMLGFTHPDELTGRRILEFAHPDHRADWQTLQDNLWKHRMPYFTLETCLIRQSGTSFWCRVTSMLFEDEDGELGYTALEDIDERRRLEASHKRLYEAQETILHLVAHDLQNPIANIQLLVDLLERDAAGQGTAAAGSSAETSRFLVLIKQACDEANVLLKDVLYLGALEITPLQKYRIDLAAFLDAQLAPHRVAAQEKGIALTLELPPQEMYAEFNPDKFSRVVHNLLTNALKFTPAGGQVSVCLREYGGHARLSVQDTGMGIPAELQAHVFDKFTTARRAGLYGESTTGLGLFITQQIVLLHGGTIWLESREHEGTTVFVDLL
ncbi:MAG: PAS domain-containing sensor histidine kinase [Hymenobacter sp.]|nr:PAS domain-containing sensor histidine kinase [Hymenobacter sp.]